MSNAMILNMNHQMRLNNSKCESLILLAREISEDRKNPTIVLEFPEEDGHNPQGLIDILTNEIPELIPDRLYYTTARAIRDWLES